MSNLEARAAQLKEARIKADSARVKAEALAAAKLAVLREIEDRHQAYNRWVEAQQVQNQASYEPCYCSPPNGRGSYYRQLP